GMGNLPRDAHFGMEAGQRAGVPGQGGGQEFNGHDLAEFEILGAIDFAHAAAAGERDEAVAAHDDLAGSEAAAADGIGAGKKRGGTGRRARRAMRWSGWMRGRAAR